MPVSRVAKDLAPPETVVTPEAAIAVTRAWVERAVIGLNLCPFAKAPQVKGRVRYVATDATRPEALLASLVEELRLLERTPAERLETTLLVHPRALAEFADYNDFLDIAEHAVRELGLEGVLQVASFHPHYRFAGSEIDDPANASNRSPHPTLHLLRETSIDRAVAAFPEAASIFEANIVTLRGLGAQGWSALKRQCRADAHDEAAWPSPSRD